MTDLAKDEEREERLHMEIIVDAYGPEEQAISWYYYLEENYMSRFLPGVLFAARPRRCNRGIKLKW